MKKAKISVAGAALLAVVFSVSAAGATPAAPRAQAFPAAPRAIVATTHQNGASADAAFLRGRGICINIDHDNRITCLLGGKPGGTDCQKRIDVVVLTYWRCGSVSKPPTPPNCLNINGDQMFTCLGAGKPQGPCTETRQLLFIHRYHCSAASARRGLRLG